MVTTDIEITDVYVDGVRRSLEKNGVGIEEGMTLDEIEDHLLHNGYGAIPDEMDVRVELKISVANS